jgi:hypothetical protein
VRGTIGILGLLPLALALHRCLVRFVSVDVELPHRGIRRTQRLTQRLVSSVRRRLRSFCASLLSGCGPSTCSAVWAASTWQLTCARCRARLFRLLRRQPLTGVVLPTAPRNAEPRCGQPVAMLEVAIAPLRLEADDVLP